MVKIANIMKNNPASAGTVNPKKNAPCLAQFSLDNAWYRARISEVEGDNITVGRAALLYACLERNKFLITGTGVLFRLW